MLSKDRSFLKLSWSAIEAGAGVDTRGAGSVCLRAGKVISLDTDV